MTKQRKEAPKPWHPATYDPDGADTAAIKALAAGNASEYQQKRALDWIIKTVCGTYDLPFRPGPDGQRDTEFACGKMFVGQQIVKHINMPVPTKPAVR